MLSAAGLYGMGIEQSHTHQLDLRPKRLDEIVPPDGGAGATVRHFDYDVHPITGKSITPAQIKKKTKTKNPLADCARHSGM